MKLRHLEVGEHPLQFESLLAAMCLQVAERELLPSTASVCKRSFSSGGNDRYVQLGSACTVGGIFSSFSDFVSLTVHRAPTRLRQNSTCTVSSMRNGVAFGAFDDQALQRLQVRAIAQ